MRPSDPKALTVYRTASPTGWAACRKATGLGWRITDEEAARLLAASQPARAS